MKAKPLDSCVSGLRITLTLSATRPSADNHALMSSAVTHVGRFPRNTVKLILGGYSLRSRVFNGVGTQGGILSLILTQACVYRKQKVPMKRLNFITTLATAAALLALAPLQAQSIDQIALKPPLKPGETLVLGFLGGFEKWNNEHRGVRKLILKLRETPGLQAESFRNQRRKTARRFLLDALDSNRDGKLDPSEKSSARIILIGQSWGGAAIVQLSRELNKLQIPVLLTVQIDSVGTHDSTIPPNVRSAINFFQREPLTVWGEDQIRAANPTNTRILGNIRHYYPIFLSPSRPESKARRWFGGGHARMEADPILWAEVEFLIRAAAAGSELIIAPKWLQDGLKPDANATLPTSK